jgi:hypothetical protein
MPVAAKNRRAQREVHLSIDEALLTPYRDRFLHPDLTTTVGDVLARWDCS